MKTPVPLPSREELHRLFTYDAATGVLIRNDRPELPIGIRNRFCGKPTGYRTERGYIQVCISRKLFTAHRIIWKMIHGTEPALIDHRDGNPSNNRIDNLREATPALNNANSADRKRVLPRGVTPTPAGRFRAEIGNGKRTKYIGTFSTPEEASAAYQRKAAEIYGEFCRHART